MIRLPFLNKNVSRFFSLPSPNKTCALPFDFALDIDPKNISYYQHDVKNYMDQVLDFSSYGRHKYIHSESSSL